MSQKYDSVIVHNSRETQRLARKIDKMMWFLSTLIGINLVAVIGIAITMFSE